MAYKVFIDGSEGTTGLKIFERFAGRSDVEMLRIPEEARKDPSARKKMINESDITFLCLPDAAAEESAALCDNPRVKIIDASTAHRTNPLWAYGFPELSAEFRRNIAESKRVAVPGCYASGFASVCYPLVRLGILPPDYPVVCHAVSGYSGAGKKAVLQYEAAERDAELDSPRQYALSQQHKHLPEMQKISALAFAPVFNPYICDYYAGMAVSVPLHTRLLSRKMTAQDIRENLAEYYAGCTFIKVAQFMGTDILRDGFIAANELVGTNRMELFVCGNDERVLICSRFDNLGKGASGAAVQCMNIMLGVPEDTALA
ncbi:MAG: N-acetyl-gamma-glutamyl-phosphate reductase [Bacteroides sp.]|nr:N-acetyl-gamma-glutamyl-phosphate reductase [Prevotella sp.]MCM1408721.1 N-acetyl-gamma-glutamyl-phosphate reductase [Treponema brennaborense]MCM1470636.1 N-acetyl-gamma-glutamyl-phosphate reductase [Bacteroides sp.]